MKYWRAFRNLLYAQKHWDLVFDKSGAMLRDALDRNPGWPTGRSIAVSTDTYLELRNKLNRDRIVYDEETGREFLLPCAVFKVKTE